MMPKIEVLNDNTHKNIKIDLDLHAKLIAKTGAIAIFPSEIVFAQRFFPVVFRRHEETQKLIPNVMFGVEQDENLFVWKNSGLDYEPLSFVKGPFLMGPHKASDDSIEKHVLFVDIEDPRISQEVGDPIFLDSSISSYLDSARKALRVLHEELPVLRQMVDLFEELKLLEPVSIDMQFVDGSKIKFEGAYTVAREKLENLSPKDLNLLYEKGFLSLAFYISDSLDNLGNIVELKNQKIRSQSNLN